MADMTFDDYLAKYGRRDGEYPVIDLDTEDWTRHTLIVSFAGGTKKAIVQFMGLGAGAHHEHLCVDVHAFVDNVIARSSAYGMEDGKRYEGFAEDAPGRSHGRPAVRGVAVLIGSQTDNGPKA
jgi:hypothetical protein